jgi:AP2-associated kinase
MADPAAPVGTFAPGTKIQVGSHKVVIQKYFSEGGFAHVYLVKMPKPIDGTDIAVLKRVAVPDKENLANMRTEVETMKKLKGHRPIVTYFDSHASQLKGGGYEVFLLMEFCNGGGLIDFMNTRLQNRLTEPEILKIFSDVAEGVACMHYLKPPLLHRDLKVENVLITSTGSSKRFKLCDFGSTAPPRPAATTAAECRLIEDDVQKHTTLQYRSPEMIDVYRKQVIDEKSDIWALGVLLYKLCYYTTPFEAQGQLAILNASFKFPNYPLFSDKLKKLIGMPYAFRHTSVLIHAASMLKENPKSRPNIYQVLREACLMQRLEVPIKDVCQNLSSTKLKAHYGRFTPEEHSQNPDAISNYHLQNQVLHHRRSLELFFHPPHSNNQSFLTLYQCAGGGLLHKMHKGILLNRAPPQCGALPATLLRHWIPNLLLGPLMRHPVDSPA